MTNDGERVELGAKDSVRNEVAAQRATVEYRRGGGAVGHEAQLYQGLDVVVFRPMPTRLRRSLLYTPLSSESMVSKAGTRGADVLILDLEDGVHPDAKDSARSGAARLFAKTDFGRAERLVRINGCGTPWQAEDIEAVRDLPLDGIVLPKAESASDVRETDAAFDEAHPLFLMIETPAGVLHAAELALASPRVTGLVFGGADFRAATGLLPLPDERELLFARSAIVLAARAAGIEAFDTPWFDIEDAAGLGRNTTLSRALGFDGRTAVHPAQVEVIHEAFTPSETETAHAHAVISALDEAAANGRSVAVVGGQMVEALHGRQARRILDLAGHRLTP